MISAAKNLISLIICRAGQSICAAIIFPSSLTIGIGFVDLTARKGVIAALVITPSRSGLLFRSHSLLAAVLLNFGTGDGFLLLLSLCVFP